MRKILPLGTITLLFLPCIIILALKQQEEKVANLRSLQFYWSGEPRKDWMNQLFTIHPPAIDYTTYQLTGNQLGDSRQLKEIQQAIQQLKLSKDTTVGIHVYTKDSCSFQTFINLIDICFTFDSIWFCPNKNNLWIGNPRPIEESEDFGELMSCGGSFYDEPTIDIEKVSWFVKYKSLMIYLSICITLFILSIWLSIRLSKTSTN